MFAFKLSNIFPGYAYQPFSGILQPDQTECLVCRRDYGIEDEGDPTAPCQPLVTPCGHIIGSACVDRMTNKGLKMRCQTCFKDVPRHGKTWTKRLYEVSQWPLFAYNPSWIRHNAFFQKMDALVKNEEADAIEYLARLAGHLMAENLMVILVRVCVATQYALDVYGSEDFGHGIFEHCTKGINYRSWVPRLAPQRASILEVNAGFTILGLVARAAICR